MSHWYVIARGPVTYGSVELVYNIFNDPTILMNDESLYSASYIDHNNKIYMLIQEGSADNRMELANVISSWNPDK